MARCGRARDIGVGARRDRALALTLSRPAAAAPPCSFAASARAARASQSARAGRSAQTAERRRRAVRRGRTHARRIDARRGDDLARDLAASRRSSRGRALALSPPRRLRPSTSMTARRAGTVLAAKAAFSRSRPAPSSSTPSARAATDARVGRSRRCRAPPPRVATLGALGVLRDHLLHRERLRRPRARLARRAPRARSAPRAASPPPLRA